MDQIWLWVAFNAFVLVLLALDLGVFHRKAHAVSFREAAFWSVVWVTISLIFAAGVYYRRGPETGLEFLTGYLIEKALSVDNIFVFVLIFSYFRVPSKYQHKILFWGIIGALLMRGAMIAAGAALLARFHWVIYIFGAFLIFTGIKMLFHDESDLEPEVNPAIRLLRKIMPVTSSYHGQKFFIFEERDGRRVMIATPLFVVLVLVETTDLIFAVDSIPAIFAITQDTFIIYTSNVLAILGLRSLYFLLAGVIHRFHFLKAGLAIILAFVGTKMLIVEFYKIPIGISLGVIASILVIAVLASLLFPKEAEEHSPVEHGPLPDDSEPQVEDVGDGEDGTKRS